MIYDFNILKKSHYHMHNKCKYMSKNSQIIKIEHITDNIQPLIIKLYENYISIKLLNKQFTNLKYIKSKLLYDINKINENKISKLKN